MKFLVLIFRNATKLLCLFVLVGEATSQTSTKTAGAQPNYSTSNVPEVTITQPTDMYELTAWSGERPSILIKGTINNIPDGYKLFLGVHPTKSDSVWFSPTPVSGKEWINQTFFGDPEKDPPRDSDTYQVIALISNRPPPSQFVDLAQADYYLSNIVTVKVRIISWLDKLVTFGKDLQLSVPIAAFFSALGAVVGYLIKPGREPEQKGKERKGKKR